MASEGSLLATIPPLSLFLQPQAIMNYLFISTDLPIVTNIHKWNNLTYGPSSLASFI